MVVGVCRIVLLLPGNGSLKAKRAIIRSLLERMRNRYNTAVAEVDDLDNRRRATVAFAVLSNDRRHANSMLDQIGSFVTANTEAVVADRATELISLGEELGMEALAGEPGKP